MPLSSSTSSLFTARQALRRHSGFIVCLCAAAIAFTLVALITRHLHATLGQPELASGWSLFGVCCLLAALNARKKLAMLPVGRASVWKMVHVCGGFLVIALFWLHAGSPWPTGTYEQAMAVIFYAVCITGLLGLFYQSAYPRRLTQTGIEVIYERIPDEIVALREQAEEAVLSCTRESGTDTLAQFYVETFQWFFRRPRFLISHLLGGQRAAFWVSQQLSTARRYLGEHELEYLDQLSNLAHAKARLDLHYASQGILKLWLLVHVPTAFALGALVLWHILVVNIYAL
ncbi:MAG: hypothetical protein ACI8PT_002441 [Gammaproteobacteria bacterium]